MKKVLVAGAALMLAGGLYASAASAAAVEPGVKITGDARVRIGYQDDTRLGQDNFGNNSKLSTLFPATVPQVGGRYPAATNRPNYDPQSNMDSRVRLNVTGTAAGGAYAKARFRMEGQSGDIDNDPGVSEAPINNQGNLWTDIALIGIPFNDTVTLELGRYRSTYGPLGTTFNFAYDDVSSYGGKGIIKWGNVEVNPFVEWAEEAQNGEYTAGTEIPAGDDDVMRYGIHAKGKINKDWTLGGMIGGQSDSRRDNSDPTRPARQYFEANEGIFASIYVNGKAGDFGFVSEFAYTESNLNNFNSWETDTWSTTDTATDLIGSSNDGYGGYIMPSYKIDKLTLALNLGFTADGYQPDRAFGSGVMIGSADNSRISAIRVGDFGDWLWAGFFPSYQFSEATKLTGVFVYADIDAWDTKGVQGDGPQTTSGSFIADNKATGRIGGINGAWEVSAILQYTIQKNLDLFLSAGMLQPDTESGVEDDAVYGALSRLELKF